MRYKLKNWRRLIFWLFVHFGDYVLWICLISDMPPYLVLQNIHIFLMLPNALDHKHGMSYNWIASPHIHLRRFDGNLKLLISVIATSANQWYCYRKSVEGNTLFICAEIPRRKVFNKCGLWSCVAPRETLVSATASYSLQYNTKIVLLNSGNVWCVQMRRDLACITEW